MKTLCPSCSHFKRLKKAGEKYTCDAFPESIPVPILTGEVDHDKPIAGDNGIFFEPIAT